MPAPLVPIVGGLIDIGSRLIDRLFPDPAERDAAKFKLLELERSGELAELHALTEGDKAQVDVNKMDAQSEHFFQYGWRPFIGWICGTGLGYQFLARPLLGWIGSNLGWATVPIPLELDTLMTLLFGILGLGAYRTIEKRERIKVGR